MCWLGWITFVDQSWSRRDTLRSIITSTADDWDKLVATGSTVLGASMLLARLPLCVFRRSSQWQIRTKVASRSS
jgi:hypothetical protein